MCKVYMSVIKFGCFSLEKGKATIYNCVINFRKIYFLPELEMWRLYFWDIYVYIITCDTSIKYFKMLY